MLDLVPSQDGDVFLVRSHLGFVVGETLRIHFVDIGDAARIERGDLAGLEQYVDANTDERGERKIYTKADLISKYSDRPVIEDVLSVIEVGLSPRIPEDYNGY